MVDSQVKHCLGVVTVIWYNKEDLIVSHCFTLGITSIGICEEENGRTKITAIDKSMDAFPR